MVWSHQVGSVVVFALDKGQPTLPSTKEYWEFGKAHDLHPVGNEYPYNGGEYLVILLRVSQKFTFSIFIVNFCKVNSTLTLTTRMVTIGNLVCMIL